LGCKTNQRSIPFGYLLPVLDQDNRGPLQCFLEVFIAEEFDAVGHKASGDMTTVDVQVL
jgi:hypothetical protein